MVKEYHLGIYTGHDTGLAIVDGDLNILYVFEEERFNGERMTYFNPYFSLKELMRLDFNHFKTVSFGFNPSEDQKTFLKKFIKFQKLLLNSNYLNLMYNLLIVFVTCSF